MFLCNFPSPLNYSFYVLYFTITFIRTKIKIQKQRPDSFEPSLSKLSIASNLTKHRLISKFFILLLPARNTQISF